MHQHNTYDAASGCTDVINQGDLFAVAINVDLLVISAKQGFYKPESGSWVVSVLLNTCGLFVGNLRRTPALEMTQGSTIRAWVTPELENLPLKP